MGASQWPADGDASGLPAATTRVGSARRACVQIRRIADIYEWGDKALWPGLFGRIDPCNSTVGARDSPEHKGCEDDAIADGEGPFGMRGAQTPTHNLRGPTPAGLYELVRRMDVMDWSEGITFRVARTRSQPCDPHNWDVPWRRVRPRIRTQPWRPDPNATVEPVDSGRNVTCGPFVPGAACDRGGEDNLCALAKAPTRSAAFVSALLSLS